MSQRQAIAAGCPRRSGQADRLGLGHRLSHVYHPPDIEQSSDL